MQPAASTTPAVRDIPLRPWLLAGIGLELLIFAVCYVSFTDIGEVFRHAARYSGRLSALVYLFSFLYFARTFHRPDPAALANVQRLVTIFCVLHFIHFGFLATNVVLNDIELVPYKLAGGFLGYLMILLYPFFIHRIPNKKIHLVYFLYLGFIVVMTYVARLKGDFDGVTPGAVHYLGVALTVLTTVVCCYFIFARPRVQGRA